MGGLFFVEMKKEEQKRGEQDEGDVNPWGFWSPQHGPIKHTGAAGCKRNWGYWYGRIRVSGVGIDRDS
ncbi:unnamed protein product [Caenorhabditis nigoni]